MDDVASISLAHDTLAERIYKIIKEWIQLQELEPGTRILENDIATKLGVSRTPVRDSINRLSMEGLVTVIPRRGTYVASLSRKDIEDLYQLREVLEALAIELAIPLLNNKDIVELQGILRNFEEAIAEDNYQEYYELDKKFHEKIVEVSGNSKLAEIMSTIGGSVQLTRCMHCDTGEISEVALFEHKDILDACIQGDVDRAIELIREHIKRVKNELLIKV